MITITMGVNGGMLNGTLECQYKAPYGIVSHGITERCAMAGLSVESRSLEMPNESSVIVGCPSKGEKIGGMIGQYDFSRQTPH